MLLTNNYTDSIKMYYASIISKFSFQEWPFTKFSTFCMKGMIYSCVDEEWSSAE